jgi:hypothetical protein
MAALNRRISFVSPFFQPHRPRRKEGDDDREANGTDVDVLNQQLCQSEIRSNTGPSSSGNLQAAY